MLRNSLMCPCKRTLYVTHWILNRKHALINLNNKYIYNYREIRLYFRELEQSKSRPGKQVTRPTDFKNIFNFFLYLEYILKIGTRGAFLK